MEVINHNSVTSSNQISNCSTSLLNRSVNGASCSQSSTSQVINSFTNTSIRSRIERQSFESKKTKELVTASEIPIVETVGIQLPKQYLIKALIGKGAYGSVWECFDVRTKKSVAIKRSHLSNTMECKSALREIKLLRQFKHPNIVSLKQLICSSPDDFRNFQFILVIVMERMETDLHSIIRTHQTMKNSRALELLQFVSYQILCGLKYLHSVNIVHRDLKPKNILINQDCTVKICDFGISRFADVTSDREMTGYVVTRYYRSPELLLEFGSYTTAVDMWSFGCIFAEMMLGNPIWQGSNSTDQIKKIFATLGWDLNDPKNISNTESWKKSRHGALFHNLPKKDKVSFKELFKQYTPLNDQACDLLDKILVINPKERYTAEQALSHPFFARFRDPSFETKCVGFKPSEFDFEEKGLNKSQLQDAIVNEVQKDKPSVPLGEKTKESELSEIETENQNKQKKQKRFGWGDIIESVEFV